MKYTFLKRAVFTALLAFLITGIIAAQEYYTGAILDEALYNSLPQKAAQLTRAYENMPDAVSLKAYAPVPGNQGAYGTCVAWSTAYAARTISESIALNRINRQLTTENTFSPTFIYKNISSDPSGKTGTVISDALNVMKTEGAVKMLAIERTGDYFRNTSLSMFRNSQRYPIADYVILYRSDRGNPGTDLSRIDIVKKSISENKPVIIGMEVYTSFSNAKDVYNPGRQLGMYRGGHAMCVVGYDDTKYGGAFEILNSWGTDWGNGGYTWIPYTVFDQFAYHAYEMIERLDSYKDATEYDGFAQIELYGSKAGMPVVFSNGYYRTTASYESGTRFRYLLGNDKPAYVYAFASDETIRQTTQIFPLDDVTSPVLDYSENTIAFPGEYKWIQLDNQPGTDYLVVLYSKEALNIDAIRTRFTREGGTFPERVAKAVGSNFIPYNQAIYNPAELRFSATSTNTKAIFGLLLAIGHR
ncbi:hypothetical protein FACS1894172_19580 [Spirochaetia bacterium]|nr:hypothetical protein FACS1894164_02830 [Spirochaetia bacterium]GHU36580.1 hypothetical protein FACS1894172_19580 [Spirochaetia bacterium]